MSKRAIARRVLRRSMPDRSEARSRALALETDGRIRDAISAWTDLNREVSDPWIEAHLVDLRCDPRTFDVGTDVYKDALAARPVDPWPREMADPFPDVSDRVPEINADELSMEILGGAILHHGCVLVRGLMAPDDAENLRATTDRAFAGRRRHLEGAPSGETTPWYLPCAEWDAAEKVAANTARLFNDTCDAVHVADSPRALLQVFEAFASTKVVPVVNEYFGERAQLSVRKTMLRRVPPDAKPAFHQDGTFMGLDTRAVDIWVALTECGAGTPAPGLAVLPKRLHTSARPNAAAPEIPLMPDELEAVAAGTEIVRPHCRPGDALLFDELCLHSTGGDQPGLTQHRYALEAWMFAPSAKPDRYLSMLV